MAHLKISDLHVAVEGKEILSGINLEVEDGEVVALLGPNGHGKSTLLQVIMGNPNYEVLNGTIYLDGKNVLAMSVDERSRAGLFLGFQNPAEVPGVVNSDFINAALNARSERPISAIKLFNLFNKASKEMGMPLDFAHRNLNEGFSGGEKKRNEVLQMKLIKPDFVMLDEIDSGLDVDGIKAVAEQIDKEKDGKRTFLIISHYARLYDLVSPTRAILMINGKIVLDGDTSIIERIDREGYEWVHAEHGIRVDRRDDQIIALGECAVKESF